MQRGELAPVCRVDAHLSAPAQPLLLRPPEAGAPRPGRTVPGGAGRGKRGEKLPKVPREALVLPHLEPAAAARQVPTGRGSRARERSEGAATPRASAGLAHLAPPEPPRPAAPLPPLLGWPRPAPPPRGTLLLAPGDLGAVQGCQCRFLSAGSFSPSPGASPPTPQAPAPWRVPSTWLRQD